MLGRRAVPLARRIGLATALAIAAPIAVPAQTTLTAASTEAHTDGSVSTCASWRIPVVMEYAAARFRGMKRDAVPGMSIHGRQASV